MVFNNLIYSFSGFIATDFSSFYTDIYKTYPNNLIPINKNISFFNGIYNQIIPYIYTGFYTTTNNGGESVVPYISLSIPETNTYISKNGTLKFINYEFWLFSSFTSKININTTMTFYNVLFIPAIISENKNQYTLINKFKGLTFPKSTFTWYTTQTILNTTYSFQLIWGQGDIPQEYYSICGFAGTINVNALNPFTNTNGPYYNTYISTNDNYASNSGWVIVLAGEFDPTLVNPPYLEDD
jgi:hypothetical protein